MLSTRSERDALRDSGIGKALASLVSCGRCVHETDEPGAGITAAHRIQKAAVSMLKLCALGLSIGTDSEDQICPSLSCENQLEFSLTPRDVELALCATIGLLEHGTELAEVTREIAIEDEAAEAEAEVVTDDGERAAEMEAASATRWAPVQFDALVSAVAVQLEKGAAAE